MPTPTFSQMYDVAFDIMKTIENLHVQAAFIGSMACKLNGCDRWPNDLDIFCQNWNGTQEDLKRTLVSKNPKFYLVASKNPRATYRVLWYRISAVSRISVKVDLLVAGHALDMTPIPHNTFEVHMGLPCVPLSYLLLYKVQGWVHHGESLREIDNLKVPADVTDIKELLRIAIERGVKPLSEAYFDVDFVAKTRSRISRFTYAHPATRTLWWSIGYTANSS